MPTDLKQLSALLRYAKVTSADTVTKSLSRIAAAPEAGTVFTYIATDTAMQEASTLDTAEAYRNALKPLAGIPFAVQETISVNGQPGSAATALDLSDLIPPQGPLVKKLRGMGAVAIGKTVSSEFAFSLYNPTRGLPANPLYPNEAYTMGGSAAAIAVAEGLCSFALGVNTAGTVRASAAMCGVVGFKPGADFWSREGVFPMSRELDSIGLVTANAIDLAFMLEQLGNGAAPDMSGAKLRLGISPQTFHRDLDPAVSQAMTRTLEILTRNGAFVTSLTLPDYDELKTFNRVANGTGLLRYIGRDRLTAQFDRLDPVTQIRLKPGMDAHITEIQRLFEQRRLLANRVNSNLGHIDALVMPTLTGLPVPVASFADAEAVAEWQNRMTRNINFAGLFNMTAITIPLPAHITEGEPIGLQLVAPAGTEVKLAGVARAVQQTLDSAA